jgi:hypothetical protein
MAGTSPAMTSRNARPFSGHARLYAGHPRLSTSMSKRHDVGGWVKVVHKKTNDFLADDGIRA